MHRGETREAKGREGKGRGEAKTEQELSKGSRDGYIASTCSRVESRACNLLSWHQPISYHIIRTVTFTIYPHTFEAHTRHKTGWNDSASRWRIGLPWGIISPTIKPPKHLHLGRTQRAAVEMRGAHGTAVWYDNSYEAVDEPKLRLQQLALSFQQPWGSFCGLWGMHQHHRTRHVKVLYLTQVYR